MKTLLAVLQSLFILFIIIGCADSGIDQADVEDLLTSLEISDYTFSPEFDPAVTEYTVAVPSSTSEITLDITFDDTALITINGETLSPDGTTKLIQLSMGENKIIIVVTTEDSETSLTYTITVQRGLQDADLAGISLSEGILSPVFDPAVLSYSATVPEAVTAAAVTPISSSSYSAITVNSVEVTSGTASQSIDLVMGINTITIQVTADDGTTIKAYTISLLRASSNADLTDLVYDGPESMSPAFAQETVLYYVVLFSGYFTFTPTAADENAAITVNGVPVSSGSVSQVIDFVPDLMLIDIVVTAEDGVTTKTYSVYFSKMAT